MISQFAIAEIEKMQSEGLAPTPADIIRLNAVGLKVDHSDADAALYQCRRTATIVQQLPDRADAGAPLRLQEPTIGHTLYISHLRDLGYDIDDDTTLTICRAWVFSHDVDALPVVNSSEEVTALVCAFMEKYCLRVTFARLKMAVAYVMFGYDSATLERPAPIDGPSPDEDQPTADDEAVNDSWNFALGVIHKAESVGLGISLADARRHTVAEMNAIVEDAIDHHYRLAFGNKTVSKVYKDHYTKQFYATLTEIRDRLTAEKTT